MAEANNRFSNHPAVTGQHTHPGHPGVSAASQPAAPTPNAVPGPVPSQNAGPGHPQGLPQGHGQGHMPGMPSSPQQAGHLMPQVPGQVPQPSPQAGTDSASPTHPSSRTRVPRLELSEAPAGRCVVIRCEGRAFAYRCAPGQESELLDRVLQDARDESHPLTFFDAALIAHRLGRQIAEDLDNLDPSLRRGA